MSYISLLTSTQTVRCYNELSRSRVVDRTPKPAVTVTEAVPDHEQRAAKNPVAPQPPVLTPTEPRASTVHLTPQAQFTPQPTGAMSFHPAQCSPLIPMLLPQHQGGGPYAIYMHPSSFRPHPLTRPQPTSLAVRSMTFEDKTGRSPSDVTVQGHSSATNKLPTSSPSALKRVCSERTSEESPSKAKRIDSSTRVRPVLYMLLLLLRSSVVPTLTRM